MDINAESEIYKPVETIDKIKRISGGELAECSIAQLCKGVSSEVRGKAELKSASSYGKSGLWGMGIRQAWEWENDGGK